MPDRGLDGSGKRFVTMRESSPTDDGLTRQAASKGLDYSVEQFGRDS